MKNIFYLIFTSILLSSCAFHSGIMTGDAIISGTNFELLTIAKGTSTTQHVFGIGGLDKTALIFEAKKNMYANYPLKRGQAYVNFTLDSKTTFAIIVIYSRITITADIVQYYDETTSIDTSLYSGYQALFKNHIPQLTDTSTKASIFSVNDSVLVNKGKNVEYCRIDHLSSNKVTLERNNKFLFNRNYSEIFSTDSIYFEQEGFPFRINQEVHCHYSEHNYYKATIKGMNNYVVLVEHDGKYQSFHFASIRAIVENKTPIE